MKASDWEDLALFAAVARDGSIGAAALATGVSQATLSRRMRAFEDRLQRRLFVHGASGYALTPDGRALHARTRPMEAAAAEIAHWQAAAAGPVPVRISAGTWTGLQISERLTEIWAPDAPWVPELIQSEAPLDLARREIDIGIRNARPEGAWLAGQRVGNTEFAVFATSEAVNGWIGPARGTPRTRSARWLEERFGARIVTRTNAPLHAYHMARAGIGRVVLPVEIGARAPELRQLSPVIAELTSEQWLVSHQDARHEPAIRAALTALAGILAPRPSDA